MLHWHVQLQCVRDTQHSLCTVCFASRAQCKLVEYATLPKAWRMLTRLCNAARHTHSSLRDPAGCMCRVNDGYCDCQNGADEPGTGACAQLVGSHPDGIAMFHCADGARQLHPVFVDDGVCDCDDRSDEEWQCQESLRHNGAHDFGAPDTPSVDEKLGAAAGSGA